VLLALPPVAPPALPLSGIGGCGFRLQAPASVSPTNATANEMDHRLERRIRPDMARLGYERSVPKSFTFDAFAAVSLLLVACTSKPLEPSSEVNGAGGVGEAGVGGSADAEPSTVVTLLDDARISSDQAAEDFQRVTSEVDFGEQPVVRASLSVQLRSPCFPFSDWGKLGVPAGQRWPEPCDAFDRTISIRLDSPESADDPVGLELVRAITPFGGPESIEADITDVVNGLPGKHRFSVHVDTWSDADGLVSGAKGEWYASAKLEMWPGKPEHRVLAVVPLVLGEQTEVDAAPIGFEVPNGTKQGRLEYRATGHGAVSAFTASCRGPAEEFCRRSHTLVLDDETLAELEPWRDDCAALCTVTTNESSYGPQSYCAENPCGDQNSVRAPRANWCPGSTTPPFVLDGDALAVAGPHQLSRRIAALAPGGTWTISLTYFAFE
jgi:hypothetical protein